MTYEFLEHTADVKFKANGNSINEVFEEVGKALIETINAGVYIKGKIVKQISIKGESLENLLYNFLEEFLFLLDAEGFVTISIKTIEVDIDNFSLIAELVGDSVYNYDNFSNEVKAITYSDMSIKNIGNVWEVVGVFDV